LRDSEAVGKARGAAKDAIKDLREGDAGRKAKEAIKDLRDSEAVGKARGAAKDAIKDLREGDAGRKAKEAIKDLRDSASGRGKS
jgi:hypothetical protein